MNESLHVFYSNVNENIIVYKKKKSISKERKKKKCINQYT